MKTDCKNRQHGYVYITDSSMMRIRLVSCTSTFVFKRRTSVAYQVKFNYLDQAFERYSSEFNFASSIDFEKREKCALPTT